MDCPKCVGKLQKTTITDRATSGIKELQGATITYQLEVDKCFACGGVWFDKGELDKYLTEQLTVIDSPSVGAKLDQKLDQKEGKCPQCEAQMKRTAVPKASDMAIDICEKCHGIWLDPTEVDRLERAHKSKLGFLALFFKGFRRPQS